MQNNIKIRSQGLDTEHWLATGQFEIVDEPSLNIEQLAQWLHKIRLLTPSENQDCLPALYVYSAAGQWLSFYTERDGLYCPEYPNEKLSVEDALHLIQRPQRLHAFEAKKSSIGMLFVIVILVLLSF